MQAPIHQVQVFFFADVISIKHTGRVTEPILHLRENGPSSVTSLGPFETAKFVARHVKTSRTAGARLPYRTRMVGGNR